ncbi:peptidoglycan-binding protein [Faunimonas sp. B44]|uniref:peptidoglycan-binding protein n=1 Tax=Faunimonas sp. B44 TaxID=3461493 RepID=UPI0040440DF1
MNSRETWNLRTGRPQTEPPTEWGREADQLRRSASEGRFDPASRNAEPSARDRVSERLEAGLRGFSAADLERAVERLARDIEDIGRNAAEPRPEPVRSRPADPARPEMSSTLQRLEARLDALADRLERRPQRSEPRPAAPEPERDMIRSVELLAARIDRIQDMLSAAAPERSDDAIDEIGRKLDNVAREGQAVSEGLSDLRTQIGALKDALRAEPDAPAGHAGELKQVLEEVGTRLDAIAASVPSRDSVERGYAALMDRLDRMQPQTGPDEPDAALAERLDSLRQEVKALPSHDQMARLEEGLLDLADRLDNMAERVDRKPFGRLESQIEQLADQLAELRRMRAGGAAELQASLDAIARGIDAVPGRVPAIDVQGLEDRLSALQGGMERGFAETGRTTLARVEKQFATLADAIEQIEARTAERLSGELDRRFEALDQTAARFAETGAAPGLDGVERRLEELHALISEQGRLLAAPQTEQIDRRLEQIQAKLANSRADERIGRQLEPVLEGLEAIAKRIDARLAPDFGILAERMAALDARLAAFSPAGQAPDVLKSELDGITGRLDRLAGAPAIDLDRFERIMARLEERVAAEEGASRLEQIEARLEAIGQAMDRSGGLPQGEDIADLRGDIASLRRELRSLGTGGSGEVTALLTDLSQRVDAIGREKPVTARDLEAQVGRILAMIAGAERDGPDIEAIEARLRTIQDRLDGVRGEGLSGNLHALPPDRDAETVKALARNLSADIGALKASGDVVDPADRESLEAVQETLEAVMKRLAFLERDARPPAPNPAAPSTAAPPPMERDAGHAIRARHLSRTGAAPDRSAPPEITLNQAPAAAEREAPAVEPPAQAERAGAEPARAGAGILGRLTSSQLLRRATAGRTESFSPDTEEVEEPQDAPLEPGTDSPLDSALSGAPSSDTAMMSGAGRAGPRPAPPAAQAPNLRPSGAAFEKVARSAGAPAAKGADSDFLAAARRAAQAASAEAAAADFRAGATPSQSPLSRTMAAVKARRRMVLAAALAVAVALAALQFVRQRAADGPEVASAPVTEMAEPTGPVADLEGSTAGAETGQTAAGAAPEEPAQPAATAGPAVEPRADETAALPAAPDATQTQTQTPAAAAPAPARPAAIPLPPDTIGPDRLRTAASQGNPAAQFEVAARFAEGLGVEQDLAKAAEWYRLAAEAGLAPAQYRLGSIYEKGLGVPKDLARAQDWYRRASESGNVKAMHNLAVLHAEGAAGQPNLEEAARLFRRAADYGVRDSQFNIAILYARGLGVPQDMIEAYKWFAVAGRAGDAEAERRRDVIAKALSAADLAKADAAADGFVPLEADRRANVVAEPEGGWGPPKQDARISTTGDLIARVQALLSERGFDVGNPDGRDGPRTRRAIALFQERAGLPVTGEIDTGTIAALAEGSV